MIVKIKKGTRPFCDFKFPRWGIDLGRGEVDRPFEVDATVNGKLRLRAFGYGLMQSEYGEGAYGCGAVYCDPDAVEELPDCDITCVYKPIDVSPQACLQRLCMTMNAELNKLGCHKFDDEVNQLC